MDNLCATEGLFTTAGTGTARQSLSTGYPQNIPQIHFSGALIRLIPVSYLLIVIYKYCLHDIRNEVGRVIHNRECGQIPRIRVGPRTLRTQCAACRRRPNTVGRERASPGKTTLGRPGSLPKPVENSSGFSRCGEGMVEAAESAVSVIPQMAPQEGSCAGPRHRQYPLTNSIKISILRHD